MPSGDWSCAPKLFAGRYFLFYSNILHRQNLAMRGRYYQMLRRSHNTLQPLNGWSLLVSRRPLSLQLRAILLASM
jgi:hypothetical protein